MMTTIHQHVIYDESLMNYQRKVMMPAREFDQKYMVPAQRDVSCWISLKPILTGMALHILMALSKILMVAQNRWKIRIGYANSIRN